MDGESLLRQRIESALITASWFEAFRQRSGLTGVSQVWAEVPAWYFWISTPHRAGAYELRLEATSASENGDGRLCGCFTVRFYPSREDAQALGFSREEQLFLCSDLFDDTGTPRAERRDEVPARLFQVGVLEMLCGRGESDTVLTFESLDRMVTVCETPHSVKVPVLGACLELAGGTTARSVPGWQLGHVLFDRLVGLLAHHTRCPPTRTRLTEEPAFGIGWGADGFVERPSNNGKLRTLTVALAGAAPVPSRTPDRQVVVHDRHWCAPPPSGCCGAEKPDWINPNWWDLARADFKTTLASSCGCAADH